MSEEKSLSRWKGEVSNNLAMSSKRGAIFLGLRMFSLNNKLIWTFLKEIQKYVFLDHETKNYTFIIN